MSSFVALLVTSLLALAPARVVTSSEDAYTASVRTLLEAELVRAGVAAKVTVREPLGLKVSGGGRDVAVGLDRPWSSCQRQADGCQAFTEEYLRQASKQLAVIIQGEPPLEAKQLRLIVRNADYIDTIKKQLPDVVARPLAGHLWLVLVADFPAAARPLAERELAALKLDKARAEAVALGNCKQQIGTLDTLAKQPKGQEVAYLTPPNYYNGALLAAPADWAALAKRMKGRLLVTVPNDEMVLYIDDASLGGALVLQTLGQRIHDEAKRPVSTDILQWTANGWKTWSPK